MNVYGRQEKVNESCATEMELLYSQCPAPIFMSTLAKKIEAYFNAEGWIIETPEQGIRVFCDVYDRLRLPV